MTVGQLLAASRDAHTRKKHAAGTVDQQGTVTSQPNYPVAESHIAEALRLRLEADALDPAHTSPDWDADQRANKGVSHDALIAFFRAYPAIP